MPVQEHEFDLNASLLKIQTIMSIFFQMWHLIHKQIIRHHIGNILFNSFYHNTGRE